MTKAFVEQSLASPGLLITPRIKNSFIKIFYWTNLLKDSVVGINCGKTCVHLMHHSECILTDHVANHCSLRKCACSQVPMFVPQTSLAAADINP